MEKCRKNRDATPFGCDDSIPCTWLCGRGGLRSSNFSINSREILVAGVDLISYIMLFDFLYFIFIPVCILSYWLAVTSQHDGKIHWKDITNGDLVLSILLGLLPILNIGVSITCAIVTIYETGWFDKPLFKDK